MQGAGAPPAVRARLRCARIPTPIGFQRDECVQRFALPARASSVCAYVSAAMSPRRIAATASTADRLTSSFTAVASTLVDPSAKPMAVIATAPPIASRRVHPRIGRVRARIGGSFDALIRCKGWIVQRANLLRRGLAGSRVESPSPAVSVLVGSRVGDHHPRLLFEVVAAAGEQQRLARELFGLCGVASFRWQRASSIHSCALSG